MTKCNNTPLAYTIATNFEFAGFLYDLVLSKYIRDNALALSLKPNDGGPVAVCTVNIDGLDTDELAIKDQPENYGMVNALIEQGIVTAPHRHIISGFEMVPITRLVDPKPWIHRT